MIVRLDSQVVLVVKNPPANGDMRCGFDHWVRKIPYRRKWRPTPIFLLGESHAQRSLAGLQSIGSQSWTWLKWLSTLLYYMLWWESGCRVGSLLLSPLVFGDIILLVLASGIYAASKYATCLLWCFKVGMPSLFSLCLGHWQNGKASKAGCRTELPSGRELEFWLTIRKVVCSRGTTAPDYSQSGDNLHHIKFPPWLSSKESTCNVGATGDAGSIPGPGRSPGEENDNPLQYSCGRIPWTEELGGLQSIVSHGVGHEAS